MTTNYTARWLYGNADLEDAHTIRFTVFCDEQGYTTAEEIDDKDACSHHIVVYSGDQAVGTGRMYQAEDKTFRMGRIAVRKEWRGTGLGLFIMKAMEQKAKELGANYAILDAQCRVIPFYEKAGYLVCGEEHMDGHVPHKMMKKSL